MPKNDVSLSQDSHAERGPQDKNQMKGEKQNTGWSSRMAKGLGIAFLAISAGGQGVESRSLSPEYSGSALSLRGNNSLMERNASSAIDCMSSNNLTDYCNVPPPPAVEANSLIRLLN